MKIPAVKLHSKVQPQTQQDLHATSKRGPKLKSHQIIVSSLLKIYIRSHTCLCSIDEKQAGVHHHLSGQHISQMTSNNFPFQVFNIKITVIHEPTFINFFETSFGLTPFLLKKVVISIRTQIHKVYVQLTLKAHKNKIQPSCFYTQNDYKELTYLHSLQS